MSKFIPIFLLIWFLSSCGHEKTSDRTVKFYLQDTFWINNSVPVSQTDAQSLGSGTVIYFSPDGEVRMLNDAYYQEGDSIRLAEPKAAPKTGYWQVEGRQVEVMLQEVGGVSDVAKHGQGGTIFTLEDNLLVSKKDSFTLARNLEGKVKNILINK
jgi:hypothetical protein